jgi:hypothetical protein
VCVTPSAQGEQGTVERATKLGQGVLDVRWDLGADLAVHDAVAFQLAQLLGQDLLAHAGQLAAENTEPARLDAERPEHHGLPLAANHIHGGIKPARVDLLGHRLMLTAYLPRGKYPL